MRRLQLKKTRKGQLSDGFFSSSDEEIELEATKRNTANPPDIEAFDE